MVIMLEVIHAQRRWGRDDDAPKLDVLRMTHDGRDGVYFSDAPESAYAWGCSRTYSCADTFPSRGVDRALREFMAENGQTLVHYERL
jgi:hypothetical protein